MIVLCARCGTRLSAPADPCPTCEPARLPSRLERFAVAYAAERAAGVQPEDAARASAEIARARVEA